MCIDFNFRNTVVWPIHTAGERVNSTSIQFVHEQRLTGIWIPCVLFASNRSPMYKSLTKTKNTQSLKHMKN